MRNGAFVGRRTAGHSNADSARCPVCREPRRFHNALGSVRADNECTLPYGDPDAPAATPAATPGPPMTILGDHDLAAAVRIVLERAQFIAARWYCPRCIAWPLDPGDCGVCAAPLQPVYLATLPREVPE